MDRRWPLGALSEFLGIVLLGFPDFMPGGVGTIAELKADDATVRIRAAAQILDRAWGRPRQAVEAAVTVQPTVVHPDVDAANVLQGLSELGLIQPGPGRTFNGD